MALNQEQMAPNGDGSPTQDSDADEFNAALKVLSGDTAPAQEVAAGGAEDDGGQGADESSAPADDAAAQEQAADGESSPAGQNPEDDIWANAPPELRKAYEDTKRDADLRLKSIQGRQSALERELNRLKDQPGQQQQGPNDQTDTGRQSDTQGADQGQGDAEEAEIERLREDYPDLAEPILKRLAKQQVQIDRLSEGVGEFKQTQTQAAISAQEELLSQAHPDWLQVARDDRFGGWLQSQPTSLQEAYKRNSRNIVDGGDAALVIGKFKADLGIETSSGEQQGDPDPQPKSDVTGRRQRQMNSGRDAGNNGPAAAAGVSENDFNAALGPAIREIETQRNR